MTTVDIFDVGHGQCALLTCDDGKRVLIDCGSSTEKGGWSPTSHLLSLGVNTIAMLVITNFDEDHARGLPELRKSGIAIQRLLCNNTVSADVLKTLKSEDGMGNGIDTLSEMMRTYTDFSAPSLVLPNIERKVFRLSYPDFDDENNLSLVLYLRIDDRVSFLFPGDLETKGWASLLAADAEFRAICPKVGVLIASHHGRESGKSEVLFSDHACKPYWVVISDKGYEHETQETIAWYAARVKGAKFADQDRYVLTTRSDGHIRFVVKDYSWHGERLSDPRPVRSSWL